MFCAARRPTLPAPNAKLASSFMSSSAALFPGNRFAPLEERSQGLTRAPHTPFERAGIDLADLGRLAIGEAAGTDQRQRLALIGGDISERMNRVGKIDDARLFRIALE